MRVRLFKYAAVLLLLAGSFYSCEMKDLENEWNDSTWNKNGEAELRGYTETPYFYYYGGEKQYFELDTR
jgi:hypothetical protein